MRLLRNLAISETGFLFNPNTGDSYSVNPIGLQIILLLQQGKSVDEISAETSQTYDCEKDAFERDFYDFTMILKNYRLFENE